MLNFDGGPSPCLQARVRGHHLEAKGFPLPVWSLAALAQIEKSEVAGSEAGGRRGLVQVTDPKHEYDEPTKDTVTIAIILVIASILLGIGLAGLFWWLPSR
jgi:hypothetical protein